MRNPETTKKTSTPRNPPGSHDGSRWKTSTATMARARNPSRPASRPVAAGGRAGASRSPTCASPPGAAVTAVP